MKIIRSNLTDNLIVSVEKKERGMLAPVFHSHNAYEIYILSSGQRNIFLKNQIYKTESGDAAMIKPDVPHRSFGSVSYGGICISFSEECLRRNFSLRERHMILACFEKPIISLSKDALEMVWRKAKDVESEHMSKREYLLDTAEFLNKYAPYSNSEDKLTLQTDLSPIGNYIQEHYTQINGLDDLVKRFRVSKSYLCRIFKKQTKITVTDYINSLRIQHACQLLTETDLPVKEIGRMCGYKSVIYFNRVFKTIMEDTPCTIREKAKKSRIYIRDDEEDME
ncbi:MAG: AraC family transcriptional regulator [Clostridia bacterium]|nr:AraC family transcriptional regulator [Clostridia bacterium]